MGLDMDTDTNIKIRTMVYFQQALETCECLEPFPDC